MSQRDVKLAELLPLKRGEYIRRKLDEKNLDRMRGAITGRDWPFPAIRVRSLDKPRKVKGVTYTLAIIDGEHRRFLATESKRLTIPAIVEKMSETEADIVALETNITHGLLLDKKKRRLWVKHLIKDRKVKVPMLAKKLHLTPRSIYRMLKDTEEMNRPAKSAAKRTKKGKPENEGAEERSVSWTVEGFFTSLAAVTKEARQHADEVQTFYRAHKDKLEAHVGPLLEILQ
jgi:ParB-like chromosome segregation protein Spo0J